MMMMYLKRIFTIFTTHGSLFTISYLPNLIINTLKKKIF